ncbi:mmgE/PrpD family protein [Burkholderia thailandensis MSMB121]|uniref:MmgE/PrpD family protein n=1 Tax=Burkholderia humptydooensis TaxID=430531 RepID=UPI000328092E|nr:MmgE/PrpD family protein [Burkholderia humptydooensis]AGK50559.1 mmgE/PrpD family protein [Burkholderia thailandensis MSMB121]ATF33294.1 MmgE/PrpD family protein [Burkholderia thailandensis]KST71379.1 2-methylcitrate dehydratase [Burkholderia humptydooensis]
MTTVDPILILAQSAFSTDVEQIPQDVMAFQRLRLLDHLACLAAGYDAAGVQQAIEFAQRYSGCSEATVLGSDLRLAAGQAAFVNAVRARALDYCDVVSPGWHPSSSDLPVALAIAEMTGASGREMLAAMAIGQDIGQRINLAAQSNGFFYRGFDSNVLGLFSGAIIAARLLRLPSERYVDAIGLAFDYGVGTFQHYQDKVMSVRFGQGLIARHAIEAAILAQAGVTGPRRILAGENGFFNLYAPGEPDLSILTEDLGVRFLGRAETCFKAYPHCSILLALTDSLLAAKSDILGLRLDACDIRLEVSPTMRMVCGAHYQPSDTAQIDAQFSAQYVTANALLRGSATPSEFHADAARETMVVELAQRIELVEVPEFERFDQCRLSITEQQVECFSIDAAYGKGWPENPLGIEELLNKFRVCCGQSACAGFHTHHEEIAALVDDLERAPSIDMLVGMIGGNG